MFLSVKYTRIAVKLMTWNKVADTGVTTSDGKNSNLEM